MAAALLLQVAAAPATVDLSSYLAAAPSPDWVEIGAASDILSGEFTAHDYAEYLKAAGASPGRIEFELNLYGFRDGYAREWAQKGTRDLLIERVFGFGDERGARFWFSQLKSGAATSPDFNHAITVPSTLPGAYAALLGKSGDELSYRVYMRKGNLMFVIHAATASGDLTSLALGQAQLEYEMAPASVPLGHGAGASVVPAWLPAAVGIFGALVVLAVITAVVAVIRFRRSRPGMPYATAGVQMSSDGAFWWDGVRWHDARTEIPPFAQRSPDGAYWWDGQTWRRSGS